MSCKLLRIGYGEIPAGAAHGRKFSDTRLLLSLSLTTPLVGTDFGCRVMMLLPVSTD